MARKSDRDTYSETHFIDFLSIYERRPRGFTYLIFLAGSFTNHSLDLTGDYRLNDGRDWQDPLDFWDDRAKKLIIFVQLPKIIAVLEITFWALSGHWTLLREDQKIKSARTLDPFIIINREEAPLWLYSAWDGGDNKTGRQIFWLFYSPWFARKVKHEHFKIGKRLTSLFCEKST